MGRTTSTGIAVTVGVLTGLGIAAAHTAAAGTAGRPQAVFDLSTPVPARAEVGVPEESAAPNFPRNARGETYGSELDAPTPDQAPDLILAIGTNMAEGYVRKTDLRDPAPLSPEHALARQQENPDAGRDIALYESDGVTVIGTFHIGAGSG